MVMTTRLYQLAFRDTSGDLVTIMDLTGAMNMRYSKVRNGFGSFLLTLPYDLAKPIMGVLDGVVQVIWTDGEGSNILDGNYLLRHKGFLGEDRTDIYTITGRSPEHLLTRRIFLSEDDPLEANGFSTKSGASDTIIREIVYEQMINPATNAARAFTGLSAPAAAGTYDFAAFREESSDAKVLTLIKKIADATGVDFWIDYDNSGPAFTFETGTIGTDRRKSTNQPLSQPYIYFSPQLGNLDQPELVIDRSEENNYVFVFGQGPAGSRLIYPKEGTGTADSPWNRCEFGVQAKNTKTVDDWITEADAALNDERSKLTSFTFNPQRGSQFARYGRDWFFGDKVTASYQDQEVEVRITGVTVNVTSGGETIDPEMELL
jgi:hypothetical protein